MRTSFSAVNVAVFLIGVVVLSGCAGSIQARDVDLRPQEKLLVNPDILVRGEGNQALYRYAKPDVSMGSYKKVMIEPIIICKSGELDAKTRENYQTLANNGLIYLTRELEQDYQIVKVPEHGTMRIQLAIIDAERTKPVLNFIGSVDPVGVGMSLVKFGATGKMMGSGEITGEIKVTDAMTGELLGAALDRRVGGRNLKGTFMVWEDANAGLEYWAKRLRFVLCKERGDGTCANPDD